MPRLRPAIILLLMATLVVTAVLWNAYYRRQLQEAAGEAAEVSSTVEGRLRPDFSLPDLDGFPREISEWQGRVLLLNFWASWCQPCRREMPAFMRLQQTYGEQGVQFIGIALDERPLVQTFLEELGVSVNYPILVGDDEAIEIAMAYGNEFGVLPYTVVVDRQGRIAHLQYGEMSEAQAEKLIQAQLSPKNL